MTKDIIYDEISFWINDADLPKKEQILRKEIREKYRYALTEIDNNFDDETQEFSNKYYSFLLENVLKDIKNEFGSKNIKYFNEKIKSILSEELTKKLLLNQKKSDNTANDFVNEYVETLFEKMYPKTSFKSMTKQNFKKMFKSLAYAFSYAPLGLPFYVGVAILSVPAVPIYSAVKSYKTNKNEKTNQSRLRD